MKNNSAPLKGYAQQFRSGLTVKEKWTIDRCIRQEKENREKYKNSSNTYKGT